MDHSITASLEDELQCSICLDVLTDPVSTPCGHNFCSACIEQCWTSSKDHHCPLCKEKYTTKPELKVNTTFRAVVHHFQRRQSCSRPAVPCDVCSGRKRPAVKSCLDCATAYCESHLENHATAPRLKKHKLMDPVENLQDYICQNHERPLELFCRDDQTCVCRFCTETDHKTHSTVPVEQESGEKKTQLGKTQADVQQMIQVRMKKIEEINHSVDLNKKNTEKEKADSVEVFRALVRCIERSQAELLEVMEEKQKAAERQAEELIKELEQEITELKRRDTELEQISHTEDHLHLLQVYPSLCRPPPTKTWTDVRINTHLRVETLRKALSQLQEALSEEMEKLPEIKMKRIQQYAGNSLRNCITSSPSTTLSSTASARRSYGSSVALNSLSKGLGELQRQYAVDVTLDPNTAYAKLILSADRKQVWHGLTPQNVPNIPERFDTTACVLGKEGFSSGRFYYEVQVRDKSSWVLGLARESVNRKGMISVSPDDGFWTIHLRNTTKYLALDSPPVLLSLNQVLQKVGVFVDYEEGLVSFYDVETSSHIYSFTGQSFTEKIYPFFFPCNKGESSRPMTICTFRRRI
ncbi:E3 ubiquitin-protein ligase TRIM69-like [Astyanax mexicanus]|uniref:E3 ubiquitin-protein ligase TRIM69-like n=1 Tax=Astyanax mexicanus TaxID=7994 RepID=UPI0020CAC472|nr:E3 ubiquitin-protein ligase TRIM69-like [Astyanax mexicanus]XP_049338633.1 E3 ubiquitin-protein ligase TRIM69-like [Astyanax mexicanus]